MVVMDKQHITKEHRYILNNADTIKKLVIQERKRQLANGKELNLESYLRGFMQGIKEKKISINNKVEDSMKHYQQNDGTKYITKIVQVDIVGLLDDVINNIVQNDMIKAEINKKYLDILSSKYSVRLKQGGSNVAYTYIKNEVVKLSEYLKTELQAKKQEKGGKLIAEDVRRFNRLQYLIKKHEQEFTKLNMRFSMTVDGTTKSHVKMRFGQKIFIISPTHIISHTDKKYIYKREEIGRTVGSLKENIDKLQQYGIKGEAHHKLGLMLATSWDLRKTVVDENGTKY